MSRKATRAFVNKKNSGLEISLEFHYGMHCREEINNVDKYRVDEWLKNKSIQLMLEFKVQFPELN